MYKQEELDFSPKTMDMYFINFKGIIVGVLCVRVDLHVRLCESTLTLENPPKNHFFWYKYSFLMRIMTLINTTCDVFRGYIAWPDTVQNKETADQY